MKWPFARHAQSPAAHAVGDVGSTTTSEPTRPEVVAPARRDWATLPPLKVAGGRPINLTASTRAFTQGLASQQVLVRSPRLEMVRQIDAPSGSFRGVLAPAVTDDDNGSAPELQTGSSLPAIEHRHATALPGEPAGEHHGLSAVEQLLAIGEPGDRTAPISHHTFEVTPPPGSDEPPDHAGPTSGRRAGLADSRRRGLGPAYHGTLPEAMRAERERGGDSTSDPGVSTEPVPGDVRAAMRDILGVDIGDRLVHRGPAVSAEAEAIGAQAFTRDGQVFLHDDVGPLDQARGRAALAHELTHAAQQIMHGAPPDETSAAGRAFEAHAQRVEQFVRGDGGAIKPSPDLLHARPVTSSDTDQAALVSSTQQMMREMVDSGLARPDGMGGIVFTMPPSSMTSKTGTQRLAGDAPQAHAASQQHWNPLESLGNTLSQGLGNDMLTMAGSMFGFSDEFMGEQRHDLVGQDRQFRRDQTTRAYTELRMEHLRRVELANINEIEATFDVERSTSVDDDTQRAIDERVTREINERLTLLDTQTARALQQLNQRRTTPQQPALADVPDENFVAALTQLFDDPVTDALPAEAALLTTLMQAATTAGHGGSTRPGGGATPHPPAGSPASTPGAHPAASAAGSTATSTGTPTGTATGTPTGAVHPTGTAPGSPAAHGGTGTGTGTAAHPAEHWRTDATVGDRFGSLGDALAGDIAHAELGFFGSVLGFDSAFEQDLHDQITPHGTAGGAHGAAAATPHPDAAHPAAAHAAGAHPDAAHPDAAHAGAAHADAAHPGAAHPGAAHETVNSIVDDPYALDELATRLYPTIRSRLRHELLIDRERAGLLADFR